MKINLGPITNSSSASYLLSVKGEAGDKESFISRFNEYLRGYIAENSWRDGFVPPRLLTSDRVAQLDDNSFLIIDYIPFYKGDTSELPQHLREIIDKCKDNKKELAEFGIIDASIEIVDLNEIIDQLE